MFSMEDFGWLGPVGSDRAERQGAHGAIYSSILAAAHVKTAENRDPDGHAKVVGLGRRGR
jgi:hypothetical protein